MDHYNVTGVYWRTEEVWFKGRVVIKVKYIVRLGRGIVLSFVKMG